MQVSVLFLGGVTLHQNTDLSRADCNSQGTRRRKEEATTCADSPHSFFSSHDDYMCCQPSFFCFCSSSTAAEPDPMSPVSYSTREIYQRFRHVAFLSTTVRDKGYLTDASQRHWQWRPMTAATAEGGLFIPISWREEKFLLGSLSRLSEMKCPSSVSQLHWV